MHLVNLEVRLATYAMQSYLPHHLALRTFHVLLVEGFKVMDEPHLAWLAHALLVRESTRAEHLGAVLNIVEESAVK